MAGENGVGNEIDRYYVEKRSMLERVGIVSLCTDMWTFSKTFILIKMKHKQLQFKSHIFSPDLRIVFVPFQLEGI
jgi:hypothetical protein